MKLSFVAVAACMGAVGAAHGGTFTPVNLGTSGTRGAITGGLNSSNGHLPSSEGGTKNSLANIMSRMYKGSASLSGVTGSIEGTLNFGNGITAVRIFDAGASGPIHLGQGAAGKQDQLWRDGVVTFETKARYAGYSQHFGYRIGTGAGAFNGSDSLLDIPSQGFFSVAGPEATLTIGAPLDFQWMRANSNNGLTNPQFSRNSNNW